MWSDDFWMDMVKLYATQSYAKKKKVGCIFVKDKHIVSAGVNGTLAGLPNVCEDSNGKTMHDIVVHAEMNAIASASDRNDIKGCTVYLNYGPCENCAKALLQFGIKKLFVRGPVKYPEVIQTCIDYLGEENVIIELEDEDEIKNEETTEIECKECCTGEYCAAKSHKATPKDGSDIRRTNKERT